MKSQDLLLRQVPFDLFPRSIQIASIEGDLTEEEEMAAIMKLEEISLRKFLEDEPDIYTLKDLKVRYK